MALEFPVRQPPTALDREAAVRIVNDARVTTFSTVRMPSHLASPTALQFGAVYGSDGNLVAESQRWGGLRGDALIAADPPRLAADIAGPPLAGTWLYLGNWMGRFGAFVSETLPNLWALSRVEGISGVLAHPFIFDSLVRPWQRQLIDGAGASGLPLVIVGREPVRVERLVVATRPVVPNAFALPEAVSVWQRVAQASQLVSGRRKVFLTTTAWRSAEVARNHTVPATFTNVAEVDEIFANAGFAVVAPETLSIEEQVALARDADLLAGWSGSALHLSAFASEQTRVLELGDRPGVREPLPRQQLLTAARRQPHGFVPAMTGPQNPQAYDLSRLVALLTALDPEAGPDEGVRVVEPEVGTVSASHATSAWSANPPSLAQLAAWHGTDKWGVHRYAAHYEAHLGFLRYERFNLFEIGIGGGDKAGASLRMWAEFFPRAEVIGLDIDDRLHVAEDRIHPYLGDQTDPAILDRILADFPAVRVIVDDGSHRPEHIRRTFDLLFPRLEDGGIYIIEDTQTSYWPAWGGSSDLADPNTTMALARSLIDGLNWEEWSPAGYTPSYTDTHVKAVHLYHNLIVIEKGENREGTARQRFEGGDPREGQHA